MFESRHFTIKQLAGGVYAAVHRPGGWAIANDGIVDLGSFTLIFDTFMTYAAAEDLLKAARQLTGSPVKLVVNSHYHNDHIWGNQVFIPQAFVLSSTETRSLITTRGKEEYVWYSKNAATELKTIQTQYDDESDDIKKEALSTWMSYYEGLVETMPNLSVCLPDVTFEEKLVIHGNERSADLIAYQEAHTPDDAVLHLTSEGIMFLGDLFFVDTHPFLADGNPDNLLDILDLIDALEPSILVPGHGPPGTKEDLSMLKGYIDHCRQTAMDMHERGEEEDGISRKVIPTSYSKWDMPNFYPANLRFYYRLISVERGK